MHHVGAIGNNHLFLLPESIKHFFTKWNKFLCVYFDGHKLAFLIINWVTCNQ